MCGKFTSRFNCRPKYKPYFDSVVKLNRSAFIPVETLCSKLVLMQCDRMHGQQMKSLALSLRQSTTAGLLLAYRNMRLNQIDQCKQPATVSDAGSAVGIIVAVVPNAHY